MVNRFWTCSVDFTPAVFFLTTNCSGVGYQTADGNLPARAFISTARSQPNPYFVTEGVVYYPDGKPRLLTMKSIRQTDGTCTSIVESPFTTIFAPLASERFSFVGPFTTK